MYYDWRDRIICIISWSFLCLASASAFIHFHTYFGTPRNQPFIGLSRCWTTAATPMHSVLLIFLIRKKQTVADRSLSPICEALSIEILSLEEQLTIAVRTSPCCGISHVQVPPSFVRNLSANIGLCERKVDLATTR